MTELLRRAVPPGADGATIRVEPNTEPADLGGRGWRWVAFAVHHLTDGASVQRSGDDREVGLIVIEGTVDVRAGVTSFGSIGSRSSPFAADAAPVVLVEPGVELAVEARGAAVVAIAAAPGGDLRATRLIEPATMRIEARGSASTARTIRHLLPPDAAAGRLILVEVLTPGGNWSSYPPHKHDSSEPCEVVNEEIYYYRIAGADQVTPSREGFGHHRTYTGPEHEAAGLEAIDETLEVRDHDIVLVPYGYHGPCMAAPGYPMYYLNVMAGPAADRALSFCDDPAHAWIRDSWSGMPVDPRCPVTSAAGRMDGLAPSYDDDQGRDAEDTP
jgi:5-deoxy-glucuronate isomerase